MDLASAYNRINKTVDNKPQFRTSLAVKTKENVISLFKQAVPLVESDKWLKACSREIKKEDYYFYLRFSSEYDIIYSRNNKELRKKKRPISTIEKIVTPKDVFQYKNQKGELDMYIRPSTSSSILGFDCSDCFDDKKALNRFKEALPKEDWVMKNLCGEQEHVFISLIDKRNLDKVQSFLVVLFKDGNAYYYTEEYPRLDYTNPYFAINGFERYLNQLEEDYLVNMVAQGISGVNKNFVYNSEIKSPLERRSGAFALYVDYFFYYKQSYPAFYKTPERKRQDYQRKGLCSYCGCTISTYDNKCEVCRKKKDY